MNDVPMPYRLSRGRAAQTVYTMSSGETFAIQNSCLVYVLFNPITGTIEAGYNIGIIKISGMHLNELAEKMNEVLVKAIQPSEFEMRDASEDQAIWIENIVFERVNA